MPSFPGVVLASAEAAVKTLVPSSSVQPLYVHCGAVVIITHTPSRLVACDTHPYRSEYSIPRFACSPASRGYQLWRTTLALAARLPLSALPNKHIVN